MKWNVCILLMLFLICGCGGRPTQMERTSFQLKAAMNKSEVKQLFAGFDFSSLSNEGYEVQGATKFYSSNKQCTSTLVFHPKSLFAPEVCGVYFNSNDVIIAHYYNLND
jgi:hypothetical protein